MTTAGAARIVIDAGDNATGVINGATSVAPRVHVTDAAGNNVAGAAVTFVVGGGLGSATPQSINTDATGIASTTWTLGSGVGPYTLDASVVGAGWSRCTRRRRTVRRRRS